MKLEDCELSYRCVRGHNVAFLFGERALTDEEGAALIAEYLESYGQRQTPAYISPAGWQLFAAPSEPEVIAAKPATVGTDPALVPAPAPAAPTKSKRAAANT